MAPAPGIGPVCGGIPPSPGTGAHPVAFALLDGEIATRLTRAGGVLHRVNPMFKIATRTHSGCHMRPSFYFRLTRFGGPLFGEMKYAKNGQKSNDSEEETWQWDTPSGLPKDKPKSKIKYGPIFSLFPIFDFPK